MKRLFLLAGLWLTATAALAEAPDRDLYVLGIGLDQNGEAGGWVQVGPPKAWKEVRAGAVLKDRLYTAEFHGALQSADLAGGRRKKIGEPEFGDTALMFAGADKLYTIESDGTLYAVNAGDGSWACVGEEKAWKAARAGVVCQGRLFTAETGGKLYAADLGDGKRKQIGKDDFGRVRFLFTADDKLYALNADGGLYRVDPGDGGRARVGKEGAWQATLAGAVFQGRLYTAEKDGTLQAAALDTGERRQVGKAEFGNTAFMFAGGDALYTLESDGSFYRIFVKPAESIDDYDWCPQEVEKVFRERGRAFYHGLHSRLVLGDKATHQGALDGLDWLRDKAAKKDLVVMYIGCHGFTDPNEGWGVETADGKTLWGHEIKAALARLPCPVLLLLETCTSGGFALPHKHDPAVPANVTALCACSGEQTTDNQLDMAVLEALYGRADFNHDGVVDLDELIRYVRQRYQEWWPYPKKHDGAQTPVIVQSASMPGSLALTKPSPDLAAVVHNGEMWSALVEKHEGDKFQVHLLGWSSTPGPYFRTRSVTRDCICLPAEGAPLSVEQNGQWYPARLLSRDGEKYKVHYLGYKEDEVVSGDRIKYPFVGRPAADKGAGPPP